ncbi:hypothetical protein D3C80_1028700 [compost metagenome]
MKKYLLTILLLLPIVAVCQENALKVPIKDGRIVYSAVIQLDSISKNELYSTAGMWFADSFKNSKHVIRFEDKEAGKIMGKGSSTFYYEYLLSTVFTDIEYSIVITVKDSKYKYEIYDIILTNRGGTPFSAEELYSIVLNKKSGKKSAAIQLEKMDLKMLSIEKSIILTMRKAKVASDGF